MIRLFVYLFIVCVHVSVLPAVATTRAPLPSIAGAGAGATPSTFLYKVQLTSYDSTAYYMVSLHSINRDSFYIFVPVYKEGDHYVFLNPAHPTYAQLPTKGQKPFFKTTSSLGAVGNTHQPHDTLIKKALGGVFQGSRIHKNAPIESVPLLAGTGGPPPALSDANLRSFRALGASVKEKSELSTLSETLDLYATHLYEVTPKPVVSTASSRAVLPPIRPIAREVSADSRAKLTVTLRPEAWTYGFLTDIRAHESVPREYYSYFSPAEQLDLLRTYNLSHLSHKINTDAHLFHVLDNRSQQGTHLFGYRHSPETYTFYKITPVFNQQNELVSLAVPKRVVEHITLPVGRSDSDAMRHALQAYYTKTYGSNAYTVGTLKSPDRYLMEATLLDLYDATPVADRKAPSGMRSIEPVAPVDASVRPSVPSVPSAPIAPADASVHPSAPSTPGRSSVSRASARPSVPKTSARSSITKGSWVRHSLTRSSTVLPSIPASSFPVSGLRSTDVHLYAYTDNRRQQHFVLAYKQPDGLWSYHHLSAFGDGTIVIPADRNDRPTAEIKSFNLKKKVPVRPSNPPSPLEDLQAYLTNTGIDSTVLDQSATLPNYDTRLLDTLLAQEIKQQRPVLSSAEAHFAAMPTIFFRVRMKGTPMFLQHPGVSSPLPDFVALSMPPRPPRGVIAIKNPSGDYQLYYGIPYSQYHSQDAIFLGSASRNSIETRGADTVTAALAPHLESHYDSLTFNKDVKGKKFHVESGFKYEDYPSAPVRERAVYDYLQETMLGVTPPTITPPAQPRQTVFLFRLFKDGVRGDPSYVLGYEHSPTAYAFYRVDPVYTLEAFHTPTGIRTKDTLTSLSVPKRMASIVVPITDSSMRMRDALQMHFDERFGRGKYKVSHGVLDRSTLESTLSLLREKRPLAGYVVADSSAPTNASSVLPPISTAQVHNSTDVVVPPPFFTDTPTSVNVVSPSVRKPSGRASGASSGCDSSFSASLVATGVPTCLAGTRAKNSRQPIKVASAPTMPTVYSPLLTQDAATSSSLLDLTDVAPTEYVALEDTMKKSRRARFIVGDKQVRSVDIQKLSTSTSVDFPSAVAVDMPVPDSAFIVPTSLDAKPSSAPNSVLTYGNNPRQRTNASRSIARYAPNDDTVTVGAAAAYPQSHVTALGSDSARYTTTDSGDAAPLLADASSSATPPKKFSNRTLIGGAIAGILTVSVVVGVAVGLSQRSHGTTPAPSPSPTPQPDPCWCDDGAGGVVPCTPSDTPDPSCPTSSASSFALLPTDAPVSAYFAQGIGNTPSLRSLPSATLLSDTSVLMGLLNGRDASASFVHTTDGTVNAHYADVFKLSNTQRLAFSSDYLYDSRMSSDTLSAYHLSFAYAYDLMDSLSFFTSISGHKSDTIHHEHLQTMLMYRVDSLTTYTGLSFGTTPDSGYSVDAWQVTGVSYALPIGSVHGLRLMGEAKILLASTTLTESSPFVTAVGLGYHYTPSLYASLSVQGFVDSAHHTSFSFVARKHF